MTNLADSSASPSVRSAFAFDRDIGVEMAFSGGKAVTYCPHTHISTVGVLMVRAGRIRLATDSGEYRLHRGDTFVIPPHHAHCIKTSDGFGLATLCLNADLFSPGLSAGQRGRIRRFLKNLAKQNQLSAGEVNAFSKIIATLSVARRGENDSLSQLRESIEANPERAMTLDEMTRAVHSDKGHLIRRFKKRYGITPHSFVAQNRLRKARRQLMVTHSLTEAALMAGFYDQSHFIRSFKRMHGITPREYLRACQPVRARVNTAAE